MKKISGIILLAVFVSTVAYPDETSTTEFNQQFNLAIKDITMGRVVDALPRLLKLSKEDPDNANLHYLIGLCYTENGNHLAEAINHLELAEKEMVKDYIVHSYTEKRVPVYVYYYLARAYALSGECSKAALAKEQFFTNYKIYVDEDYYIMNIEKAIADCINLPQEVKKEISPEESMPVLEVTKVESPEIKRKPGIINSGYKTSLYGVQIGAFKENERTNFDGINNANAFMGTDGTIRYVIGRFGLKSQAIELQNVLVKKGITDAFVVDVSKEQKFSREVLNLDYVPESKFSGKVELRVQIGAFKENISRDDVEKYLNIEGIKEVRQGDLTLLTVGSFSSYEEALTMKNKIISQGTKDAFIVAFENEKRIPLQSAINYLKTSF